MSRFSYFFMQNIGQVNFAMKYYCDLNAAHSKMGKSIQLSTLCKATTSGHSALLIINTGNGKRAGLN